MARDRDRDDEDDDTPRRDRPWEKRPRDDRGPRGEREDDYDEEDDEDERRRRRRRRRAEQESDAGMEMIVPLNATPLSIAAGYLGLFSVLCLPAPIALILGILALRELKRKPRSSGRYRAWFGIIMGTIFTLLPVIGFAVGAFSK